MKPWAAAVMAILPAEGAPSLIVSDPLSAKNAATVAAFWLHHAAVYFVPNPFNLATSITVSTELHAASAADDKATMTNPAPASLPQLSLAAGFARRLGGAFRGPTD